MNWEAIGGIGDIIGAIAVVVTLAYLARQLRVQNQANEIAAFEGVMDSFNEANAIIAGDKEKYRIFITGMNHSEQLDDNEAGQFSFLFRMYINNAQKIHRAYERGAISEQEWSYLASQTAAMIETPGGRVFIDGHGDVWKEFIDDVRKHYSESVVIEYSLGREELK